MEKEAKSPDQRPRALVVDDDAPIRQLLIDVLSDYFEVDGAEDGPEGLKRMSEESFDLIITDQMMPKMSGVEMFEASVGYCPDAVRVLITASRDLDNVINAVNRAAVDRFYSKPIKLVELRRGVIELVEGRQGEVALRGRLRSLESLEEEGLGGPKRALIVDEREGEHLTLQAVAEELGFEVRGAWDVETAFTLVNDEVFDVVIIAAEAGEGHGLEVLHAARRLQPDVEALMVSDRDPALASRALALGAYDVLTRPLDDIDLVSRRIERAYERRRLDLERQRLLLDLLDTNHALSEGNDELLRAQQALRTRVQELTLLQDATVMGFTRLAEYRDQETGEHLERMRNYSRLIAEALMGRPGFEVIDDDFIALIHKAAPLHDIGKVGIPDRVLQKPGKLDPEEWKIMRTHAEIGGRTLDEVEAKVVGIESRRVLRMGKNIAYFHHERWDGGGYPFGRREEEIPVEARIVAVADAYDAITSKRCYKEALTHEVGRELIRQAAGKQFDARVVKAFCDREADVLAIKEQYTDADELPPAAAAAVSVEA